MIDTVLLLLLQLLLLGPYGRTPMVAMFSYSHRPFSPRRLQNATTIASKFRDLYGLELALKQELRELSRVQVRRHAPGNHAQFSES